MSKIVRIAFAVLALTFAAQTQAHAQGICMPMVTCSSTAPSASASAEPYAGPRDGAANTPEISGNMFGTGMALVVGVGAMMPRRRRGVATRISAK